MGFIREDKTNGNNNGNNEIKTISSKVLATVPASNVKLNNEIIVNNVSINKDRRYYIEFLGSKKLCSVIVDKKINSIICSIKGYVIQTINLSTNLLLFIMNTNAEDTPISTDLVIYEEEVKYLDSKYLENDLTLQNSISMGRTGNIGAGSSAIGYNVEASGNFSHAEGNHTIASGDSSHAEGDSSKASGESSHTEGGDTTASGNGSHAEGDNTTASGESSHAEGGYTTASGNYGAHAEGYDTTASGDSSHAEGGGTTASGYSSHTEGDSTVASGESSHAEGYNTTASGDNQHVQGKYNIEDTANKYAHIVGNGTDDSTRANAHTLDWQGNAWYAGEVQGTNLPYTISSKVLATVPASSIKLDNNITVNNVSINKDRRYYIEFLGSKKLCSLLISEDMGNSIVCSIGNYAIQAFNNSTNLTLFISKINKDDTTTVTFTDLVIYEEEIKCLDNKYLETDLVLQNSISLGRIGNIGACSSAIGCEIEASGNFSHAEGNHTIASGNFSHAEGGGTIASGYFSHAEGGGTTASSNYQHVQGKYNIEDTANKYAHIVGNGTGNNDKSNAHTLDWQGNAWYSGEVYVGGNSQDDGKKLLSTADIYFDENGKLCITINGVTKKFTPDSE